MKNIANFFGCDKLVFYIAGNFQAVFKDWRVWRSCWLTAAVQKKDGETLRNHVKMAWKGQEVAFAMKRSHIC